MAGLASSWRSFWHSMTSYDRHASHDSPYRTGQHMPLNQSRHAPLTSVAATAMESRPDVSSPYFEGADQNGWTGSPKAPQSPTSPYSPGMRSKQRPSSRDNGGADQMTPGEIQMQSFQEGLPPPPPVSHSWKRIDRWAEDNYTELFDQLSEGCTQNDLNELEHELDCSLPIEVRESLQCHDGQERGGRPTGIIFGCMLLDCEEMVQEWRNWKTVNDEYLSVSANHPMASSTSNSHPSHASSSNSSPSKGPNPFWRQELLDKQDSQPPRAIQKAYAHPGWIPLARDWGGNNLAVDLAPGPTGKWGQIIIFGRDYDCKVVVARSWSAFLATVADDIGSEKVFVDEETQELKLREFRAQGVEPAYLDILRWRMDQKYGRRLPKKKAPNGIAPGPRRGSPYGSPTEERGRSPNRFPSRGPGQGSGSGNLSPRLATTTASGVPSPLSQVTADSVIKPFPNRPDLNIARTLESSLKDDGVGVGGGSSSGGHTEKLIEVPTPTAPTDVGREASLAALIPTSSTSASTTMTGVGEGVGGAVNKENETATTGVTGVTGLGVEGFDDLKSVAI